MSSNRQVEYLVVKELLPFERCGKISMETLIGSNIKNPLMGILTMLNKLHVKSLQSGKLHYTRPQPVDMSVQQHRD